MLIQESKIDRGVNKPPNSVHYYDMVSLMLTLHFCFHVRKMRKKYVKTDIRAEKELINPPYSYMFTMKSGGHHAGLPG